HYRAADYPPRRTVPGRIQGGPASGAGVLVSETLFAGIHRFARILRILLPVDRLPRSQVDLPASNYRRLDDARRVELADVSVTANRPQVFPVRSRGRRGRGRVCPVASRERRGRSEMEAAG